MKESPVRPARPRLFPIGELARRAGVPVKTVRFWSDEGLLPPASRSASGYRQYTEEALLRIDLLRTLRDAGLGLDAIRKVLARDMSLADALRLRLAAVEAHAASLQRVAAALRAALRGEPDASDLKRLTAVTQLSNDERRAVIETFYRKVAADIPIDEQWTEQMIDASTPKLPDDATPAQLDAWIELAELVADPTFVASLRETAKQTWEPDVDVNALRVAHDEAAAAASQLRAQGLAPDSEAARDLIFAYVDGLAVASGKRADDALRRDVKRRFELHDPRAARYWELLAAINGRVMKGQLDDWNFLAAAAQQHLP